MSEPVDLTGMTPEEAKRAVRAAAKTMKLAKPFKTAPASAKKKKTKAMGSKPSTARSGL